MRDRIDLRGGDCVWVWFTVVFATLVKRVLIVLLQNPMAEDAEDFNSEDWGQ
ncbi:hypothetical protein FIBSPDRAFT_567256 [Athelia psychrophila]|uniref:Uncharacterized protein n=1 Tax=Athelia psychrophila TaxID=1759441 RepID=A0A166I048_9AGAM|nr:hypothetical protein FIBSPDRAFT_567256 [Fibularhizoctonia sp. CBS 109695]